MIPHTIELKNFLSYGEQTQTIDFKGYDLICLSGKNGHGKSALLDALTWAIWGQARKTSGTTKADEGLLRLGQTKMLVSAEFEFNNQTYRIRREFAKTYGKPYATLDFEIFDQTRNGFISLTEKTLRTTQEKIESLLGLDYETFINTSFLRQGQANEFSKKNPKERKHILSTILGLAKYDNLQQQAQDQVRQFQDEKKIIATLLEQATQEIAQEQTLIDQAKIDHQNLETISEQYTSIQASLSQAEQKKTTIIEQKKYLDSLNQEIIQLDKKHGEKTQIFTTTVTHWKQVHRATIHLPNLKVLEQEKGQLHQQEKQFFELRQKQVSLQEQQLFLKEQLQIRHATLKNVFEKIINEKKLELEKQTLLQQQLSQTIFQKQSLLAEIQHKKLLTQQELDILISKNQNIQTLQTTYQKAKKQFEKRRNFYQVLIEKGNWLKNILQEFEHKKKLVTDTTSPACPLCEQMLTAKRKLFLGTKLINQEHFFKHQFQRVVSIINRLKQILLEQHQQNELIEKEFDLYKQQEARIRLLQLTATEIINTQEQYFKELATIQQQETEAHQKYANMLETIKFAEQELQQNTQQDPNIMEFTKRLETLEQEKQKLAFDQKTADLVHEKIQQLELLLQNIDQLKAEQQQQNIKKMSIQHLAQELKDLKKTQEKTKLQQNDLKLLVQQEETLDTMLEHIKKELIITSEQKNKLEQEHARIKHELNRLEKIKTEQTTRHTQIAKLDQEIDDYQTLATAFSKNGIQALLIEEAIPEIEHEANTILSRLTDNQAQIFIESLRDLKSGGVKESLDIHISDATGIRPYEMYSGGEAFRIDFALRIAISKLLARRAGTALQTLIIDEGFGSQDEEGLSRIMDAIHLIKNDFSKIIIVSHLPELKDNFPIHFIVEKQSTGSIIRVEERG